MKSELVSSRSYYSDTRTREPMGYVKARLIWPKSRKYFFNTDSVDQGPSVLLFPSSQSPKDSPLGILVTAHSFVLGLGSER